MRFFSVAIPASRPYKGGGRVSRWENKKLKTASMVVIYAALVRRSAKGFNILRERKVNDKK